jgi:hypothetical protein
MHCYLICTDMYRDVAPNGYIVAIHYYTKLYGGERFSFLEVGKGNRLHSKVTVNGGITEAVALPASDNLFTEAGTLERPSRLIDRKKQKKKIHEPTGEPVPEPIGEPVLSPVPGSSPTMPHAGAGMQAAAITRSRRSRPPLRGICVSGGRIRIKEARSAGSWCTTPLHRRIRHWEAQIEAPPPYPGTSWPDPP